MELPAAIEENCWISKWAPYLEFPRAYLHLCPELAGFAQQALWQKSKAVEHINLALSLASYVQR